MNRKFLLQLIVFLFIIIPSIVSAQNNSLSNGNSSKKIAFSFKLDSSANTSAGVYKKDGTLLRTLWSGVRYEAGSHKENWNGLDDLGKVVNDSYDIRVLTNNVTYQWDGSIVGNTSSVHSGSSKLRAGSQPRQMVAAGNWLYAAGGYNEASNPHWKMPLTDPTTKSYVGPEPQAYPQVTDFICADSNNVYWGGFELANTTYFRTFVVATKINTDEDVVFTNGVPFQQPNAQFFPSAIGVDNNPNTGSGATRDVTLITGMAVQKNGNYLFIARGNGGTNKISVIDKRLTHGEVVQNITSIANPTNMACDNAGHIWLAHDNNTILEKYTINSDGTIRTTGITITSIRIVGRITISPNGNEVAVCDLDDQVIRFFNSSTGAQTRTLGTVGGYLTNSTVTDTKFYWKDSRNTYFNYVCYKPDGTFYVGDVQNYRIQHFAANLSYIDNICFLTNAYVAQALQSNPTRFFVSFLEFAIDYNVPLTASTGWKLKRNWQAGFTNDFNGSEAWINNITEMPNGRTYGTMRGNPNTENVNNYFVVELVTDSIIRNTGQLINQRSKIQIDGSLVYNPEGTYMGNHSHFYRSPLTGFDGSKNPVWGAGVLIATTPLLTNNDPMGLFALYNDKLVTFNPDINFTANNTIPDYHLGVFNIGGSDWVYKGAKGTLTSYTGDYPKPGFFDNGNLVKYPGGFITASGNNLFWSYHGENWKSGQVNKFEHIDLATGLVINQFGAIGTDVFGQECAPNGADGNVLFGTYVEANEIGYIYTNGESSGSHRWSIRGLNTIQVQTATFPTSNTSDAEEGIDLMEGINWGMTTLPNNYNGWTRTPISDITDGNGFLSVLVGNRSYDKFKHPDLLLQFDRPQLDGDFTVKRDLGNNTGSTSWKLKGILNYQNQNETQHNYKGGSSFSIMDDNNKEIARFQIYQQNDGVDIIGGLGRENTNSTTGLLHHFPNSNIFELDAIGAILNHNQLLEIKCDNGFFTFKFGPYTATRTTLIDSTANWHNPKYFRWYAFSNPDQVGRLVSIQELSFINTTPINNHFRSKTNGNYNEVTSWEHSTDSTTWEAAKQIPTTAANSIVIQSGHTISVTDTATVANITVKNGGVLNIMPNAAITVNDGEGDDIVIEAGGRMNIKSDTTGNGRIATSTGTIKGNVTVEHFIPARGNGGYRLLGPSVNTTTSIKNNWQEGVNNSNVNMITNPFHGCGTHITGSTNGANGFDASITGQASLFTYNQTTPTQTWSSIGNTDYTTFDAKKGCLIFIRGSRSINVNDVLVKSDNTILRATGSIISGTVNYKAMEGNGRNSLVTNPYASSIDWVALQQSNSTKFENYYTFWDPNIGSQGGYVTVDATGTPSVRTSAATTEIQSGQAFLIKAKPGVSSPDFTIQESHKSSGNNLGVFKTTGVAPQKLYASLYYKDLNSNRILADGVLARFSDDYSRDVDGDDADDMSNFDENIAFARNKSTLSIESRPSVKTLDTLYIKLNNVKAQHYEWQFNASDFDSTMIMQAYLKDAFLKTETKISVTQTTVIGFDVTSNPFSASADRFSIVFKNAETLPVKMLSVKAYETEGGVKVDWKTTSEISMDKYEVEKSADGQSFSMATTLSAKGNSNSINDYTWLDTKAEKGNNYYRIRSTSKDGSFEYSSIVKVLVSKSNSSSLNVYPNPVQGKDFNIDMKNFEKGKYLVKLLNTSGQTISTNTFDHPGGSVTQKVNVDKSFAPGTYLVQVVGSNQTTIQYIMKQ